MDEVIKKILHAGAQAPSGDNLQPWRFEPDSRCIKIYLGGEGKDSVYDYKRLASLCAIGAVIENMVVAAQALNYEPDVWLAPNPKDNACVAKISLKNKRNETLDPYKVSLFAAITKRKTNRRPYALGSVSLEQQNRLIKAAKEVHTKTDLQMVREKKEIRRSAKLLSYNDRLLFQNKALHDGLYPYFRWSEKEMQQKKSGLYVKTLQISWIEVIGLWLMRSWLFLKFLHLLRVPSLIAFKSSLVYARSGAFGVISMPTNSARAFIEGGRIFQRVWLEATTMGLSIQPLFGFAVFAQRVASEEFSVFSKAEQEQIMQITNELKKMFFVGDRTMVMLFRIGTADEPSAESVKKKVAELTKNKE